MSAEFGETRDIIRWQRFLEPRDVVGGEHLGCAESPFVAMRPVRFTPTGVDHQLNVWADCLAGRADEQLVGLVVVAAEWLPAELDGFEAASDGMAELFAQGIGFGEEERAIGFDAAAVDAA